MRVFICGQKSFGAEVFKALDADGHTIVGVASPIDVDPLTQLAIMSDVPVTPAGTLTSRNLPDRVDLIVTAFCHDFISEKTRNRTTHGGIGFHPSILPRHRGRDAVEWTIRMRDPIAGGSVYWLANKCDGGDIAAQEHVSVRPGETAKELYRRALFPMGVTLIRRVVADIRNGIVVRVPQDELCATWEPSIGRPPLFKPELPQLPPAGSTLIYRTNFDAIHGDSTETTNP